MRRAGLVSEQQSGEEEEGDETRHAVPLLAILSFNACAMQPAAAPSSGLDGVR